MPIHICGVNGCQYETKRTDRLKMHKMSKHKIGVVYHQCDVPGCQYKAKQKGTLKTHKAGVHDIGKVVYHPCDVSGCQFKTKTKSYIKHHETQRHKVSNVQNPNNNLSRKRSIDSVLDNQTQKKKQKTTVRRFPFLVRV